MCPLGEKMAKIWLKLQENGEKKSQMAKVMAKEKYILARTLRNIKSPLDCQILLDQMGNGLAKFNVSKCHSMRVTWLHPSRNLQFNDTLHQQTLEQVQSAAYLGLIITDDLDCGQHISKFTCKATKTLGFLRHNLALRHTEEVAYKTLVRPQLEYAAFWHPYNDTQTAEVEKVQKTAARWTCRREEHQ